MHDRIPKPDRRAIPDRRARTQAPSAPATPTAPLAPAAAREREARHTRAFHCCPIALAHVTPDGQWIEVNQRALDLLGYSREELLGLRFPAFTHPDDVAADRAGRARLLAGEIPQHRIEKRYIRKDGSIVFVYASVSVLRDNSGQPLHLIRGDVVIPACDQQPARDRRRNAVQLPRGVGVVDQSASQVDAVQFQLAWLCFDNWQSRASFALQVGKPLQVGYLRKVD